MRRIGLLGNTFHCIVVALLLAPWALYMGYLPGGSNPQLPTVRDLWKQAGYGGPCPPIGRHRYLWKLYALSEKLPNLDLPGARKLEEAMQGLILAQTTLVGTYEKAD